MFRLRLTLWHPICVIKRLLPMCRIFEKYFRIGGGDSCVCGRRAYFVATRSVGIEERMCNNNKVISRPFYTIQLWTEYNEI